MYIERYLSAIRIIAVLPVSWQQSHLNVIFVICQSSTRPAKGDKIIFISRETASRCLSGTRTSHTPIYHTSIVVTILYYTYHSKSQVYMYNRLYNNTMYVLRQKKKENYNYFCHHCRGQCWQIHDSGNELADLPDQRAPHVTGMLVVSHDDAGGETRSLRDRFPQVNSFPRISLSVR